MMKSSMEVMKDLNQTDPKLNGRMDCVQVRSDIFDVVLNSLKFLINLDIVNRIGIRDSKWYYI